MKRLLIAAMSVLALAASSPADASPQDGGAWTGTFNGFAGTDWAHAWGVETSDGHNWGWDQLQAVNDPDHGAVLQVSYGAGSGAHSCYESGECANPGGGQFYTDLDRMGHPELAESSTVDLRYEVKFDSGFDFGRGGKLPGLYGGDPGSESGGHHDGNAFSTRYMWRNHPSDGAGEVYFYAPDGSGYGDDIGLGAWNWPADGKWHTIEQEVDRAAGTVTVWLDGRQVLAQSDVDGLDSIPFRGILFSTFFGGSDDTWGPEKAEHAYFADFRLATSRQVPIPSSSRRPGIPG